ncbi:MAG: hypothetical protein ACFFCL_12270 [Promethearchaeota archaeon]
MLKSIRFWKKSYGKIWTLYKIIDKHPGINIDDLVDRSKWSVRQVKRVVNKLKEERMVKIRNEIVNGRTREKYYGKRAYEHMNKLPSLPPFIP